MTKRLSLATHESAHALAGLLLGRPMACAIFDENTGLSGGDERVKARPVPENYTPEKLDASHTGTPLNELLRDAVVTAAGATAVHLAGRTYGAVLLTPHDEQIIRSQCREAFPESDFMAESAFVEFSIARARVLLGKHWGMLLRVAGALDKESYLSSDDVARVAFPEVTP